MIKHQLLSGRVLLNKTGKLGNAFVEIYEDGTVRAGYYKDTAKVYETADDAYARFKESFDFSGNHSAWNICYALEEYLAQRDEGR